MAGKAGFNGDLAQFVSAAARWAHGVSPFGGFR
jgi:hypothetical protein